MTNAECDTDPYVHSPADRRESAETESRMVRDECAASKTPDRDRFRACHSASRLSVQFVVNSPGPITYDYTYAHTVVHDDERSQQVLPHRGLST